MKAKRILVLAFLLAFVLVAPDRGFPASVQHSPLPSWPLWNRFKDHFLQRDGRVIDRTDHDRTTSEGEAYALFFSLISGDRPTFRVVLSWIRNNLASGDLEHHLPAWVWGKRQNGSWGVLDVNSASDADCWTAYSLIEAGRLWRNPSYEKEGRHLLSLVGKNETRFLPGYGWVLLPGPWGFVLSDGTTRLNPSYNPFEILMFFHSVDPGGPWQFIMAAAVSHLPAIAPKGFAPDWFAVRKGGAIEKDPVKGSVGSYDAIRVYLWAGLLPGENSGRSPLLDHLGGMKSSLDTLPAPPLSVETRSGKTAGSGPPGFSAALLPYLRTFENDPTLDVQRNRLVRFKKNGLYGSPPAYYDQILALFGLGSLEGRFSFDRTGHLRLSRMRGAPRTDAGDGERGSLGRP